MTAAPRSVTGVVDGRVQGVAFRASMAEQARRLGVAGWVRNLRDGRVEFAAAGPAADVDALLAWTRQGPALARVDSLAVEEPDDPAALTSPFQVREDA